MWVIKIRWKAIFQPWCWIAGHDWERTLSLHPVWVPSVNHCKRCKKVEP